MRREKNKKDRIEEYESSSDDDSSIYLKGTKVFVKSKEKRGEEKISSYK